MFVHLLQKVPVHLVGKHCCSGRHFGIPTSLASELILLLILWLKQKREKMSTSGRDIAFLYHLALVSLQYDHKALEHITLATST